MNELRQQPPLTLVLGGFTAAAVLALLLVLAPSMVWPPAASIAFPAAGAPLARADLEQPPLQVYAVVSDRPLFNAGRKKDVEAPAEVASAAGLPDLSTYRLAGVVISSQTKIALVEKVASKQVVTVKPGDTLDGRHVDDIEDGSVTLSGTGAVETLSIPQVTDWTRTGPNTVTGGGPALANKQP